MQISITVYLRWHNFKLYIGLNLYEILDNLVRIWDLGHIECLGSDTKKERENFCQIPDISKKIEDISIGESEKVAKDAQDVASKWINSRKV